MYCKDCLHIGVCRYASGIRLLKKEPCADFMGIDKWVKLPCKVGDTIYQTDGVRIYTSTIHEITYTLSKVIFVTENTVFDEQAINNSIFLTREETEKARKCNEF